MSSRRRLARVAPGTAYATPDDLLAAAITPAFPCLLEIAIAVSAAAIFQKRIGAQTLEMNGGVPLSADRVTTFTMIGDPADAINFRLSATVTIREFYVHQVDGDAG
jgi:hypothetical protein